MDTPHSASDFKFALVPYVEGYQYYKVTFLGFDDIDESTIDEELNDSIVEKAKDNPPEKKQRIE